MRVGWIKNPRSDERIARGSIDNTCDCSNFSFWNDQTNDIAEENLLLSRAWRYETVVYLIPSSLITTTGGCGLLHDLHFSPARKYV